MNKICNDVILIIIYSILIVVIFNIIFTLKNIKIQVSFLTIIIVIGFIYFVLNRINKLRIDTFNDKLIFDLNKMVKIEREIIKKHSTKETPIKTTEETPIKTTEETPIKTTEETPSETTEETPSETTEETPIKTTEKTDNIQQEQVV